MDLSNLKTRGVVDGPVHNNHDLCPSSDYLFSIDVNYFVNDRPCIVDVYVTTPGDGQQSIVWRNNGSDISEYGSMPFSCFFESTLRSGKPEFLHTVLGILMEIGRIKITFER